MRVSITFAVTLMVAGMSLLAPAVHAQPTCAPGLPDNPPGCCNGTVVASCGFGFENQTDCYDENDPNRGCVWNGTFGWYECGDTTTQPLEDPSGTNLRECSNFCTPNDCGTAQCGGDGCGGSCGTCSGNAYCGYDDVTMLDNQCVCTPDCTNKFCGDDGCGGTCGEVCQGTDQCYDPAIGCETCQPDCAGKICGPDGCGGTCDGGMNPCFDFLGEVCSDDGTQCVQCEPQCDGKVCGSDGCTGNCGICDAYDTCSADGTECIACVPQCDGKTCGDDGCGGTCGTCADGFICNGAQTCESCTPDCTGKTCGDDGCGGSCGACDQGTCTSEGQCDLYYCSDLPMTGCCDGDKYLVCGGASTIDIEDCGAAGQACGDDGTGFPGCYEFFDVVSSVNCPARCEPQCDGKNCGDDGCGGVCGQCDTDNGEFCNENQVCEVCVPNCDGKECGLDGCGNGWDACGSCTGDGEVCNASGQCEVPERTCEHIPTGGCCEDGVYKSCDDGPQTQLRCADYGDVCGGNWFGGFAGCWPEDQYEGPKECACIPQCDGKECGPDGCGGVCGDCATGQECTDDQQCVYTYCPDLPDRRCCSGEVLSSCNLERGPFDVDCRTRNQFCGWDEETELYACVDEPDRVDPNGAPRACPAAPTCVPDCDGRVCGSDGCGGSCGVCNADAGDEEVCDFVTGQCIGETICSDLPAGGCCFREEYVGIDWPHHLSCSSTDDFPTQLRCGRVPNPNGRGMIQTTCGWDANENRVGCVPSSQGAQGRIPDALLCANNDVTCIPECNPGDSCGPDGCGGVCGVCEGDNDECVLDSDGTGGQCQTPCVPVCDNRACGDDGCGGSCGAGCESYYEECRDYEDGSSSCVPVDRCLGVSEVGCCRGTDQVATCTNLRMETERCIGSCGWSERDQRYACGRFNGETDPSGDNPLICEHLADDTCRPSCFGKECGGDGCGGSCGTCSGESSCSLTGECLPTTCYEAPGEWIEWTTTQAGCCDGDARAAICGVAGGGRYRGFTGVELGATMNVRLSECGGRGCGWDSNFQQYRCNEEGETLPTDDPSGSNPRQCAAPVCTPDCKDKECGDTDGCGGSCGTCEGNDLCVGGYCESQCEEQHTESGKAYTEEGRCSYSTLYYCDDGLPTEVSCTDIGGGFCGWNDALSAYTCGTTGESGPIGSEPLVNIDCTFPDGLCGNREGCPDGAGACPDGYTCSVAGYITDVGFGTCIPDTGLSANSCKSRCNLPRETGQCSCDPLCQRNGTCCHDYASECTGAATTFSCGDGACNTTSGESCATCAADCGVCAEGSDGAPPWNMPYARAPLQTAGGSLNTVVIHPLDDVLPLPPPLRSTELMLYVPAAQVNHAAPGGRTVWDLNATPDSNPGPLSVDGQLGQALRFYDDSGTSLVHLDGELTWYPDSDLPRQVDTRTQEPGGMSLAMWVKIPESIAGNAINTLWNGHVAKDGVDDGTRLCLSPRQGSREITVRCPNGHTIQDIRMVAGDVRNLPPSPDGTCLHMADHIDDGACLWEDATPYAERRCINEQQCLVKVPASVPGCADVTSPSLYVDAVCSRTTTPPTKTVSLLVMPEDDGGKLVLSTPTGTLQSINKVRPGTWHHVGFTYQPYARTDHQGRGMGVLYLDGNVEAASPSTSIPRILFSTTAAPAKAALSIDQRVLSNASEDDVGLIADIDDLVIYGRALGDDEMSGLRRKGSAGLRMVWPTRGAERVVGTQPSATVTAVEASHLIDPGAPAGSRPLRRASLGVRAAPDGNVVWQSDTHHDLAGLAQFSVVAWVRKSAASTTSSLLETTSGVRLELADACDGRALSATVDGETFTQSNCIHSFSRDHWSLVAITQDASRRRLFVDAVEVASTSVTNPAPLFAQGQTPEMRFSDVDVFWAGVFETALSQQKLQVWRGQGPVMWSDGTVYPDNGESRVRDYALFAERGPTSVRPRLTRNGTTVTSESGAGPLVLQKATGDRLEVPANVHFAKAEGTAGQTVAPRVFSVVVRLGISGAGTYPIVDVEQDEGTVDRSLFEAEAECNATGSCRVRGRALVAGPDVTAAADEMQFASEFFNLGGTADELDIALSFDGRHAYVAMGAIHSTSGATLNPADTLPITESLQSRSLPTRSTSTPGTRIVFSAQRGTAAAMELRDVRLYPRPISPLEAEEATQRDCNNSGCEARGRVCRASGSTTLPSCGDCQTAGLTVAAESGAMCIIAAPFGAVCDNNADCQSGLCTEGRCQEPEWSLNCTLHCRSLGRSCTDRPHGGWGCTDNCGRNYQQEADTHWSQACTWIPTLEPGTTCERDEQCISGACITANEPRFQIEAIQTCPADISDGLDISANRPACRQPADNPNRWTVNGSPATCVRPYGFLWDDPLEDLYYYEQCPPVFPVVTEAPLPTRRCGEIDDFGCKKTNRTATARRVVPEGGQDELNLFACGGCIPTTYAGKPLYVSAFSHMAPHTCKAIRENFTQSYIRRYETGTPGISTSQSDIRIMAEALLGETGPVTPQTLVELEKRGVGPELLSPAIYERQLAQLHRARRPEDTYFFAHECDASGFSIGGNTLRNPDENKVICKPNKFPNGTPCPPPGANMASGDSPHAFCDSGFCARDTGVCEDGHALLEDNEGEDRADNKDDDSGDFLVALSQRNNTSMSVRQVGALDNGSTRRRRYQLSSVNDNTLKFFGRSRSVMRLEHTMTSKPDSRAATYTERTFIMGIQVPSGQPATQCGSWANGEYQAPAGGVCEASIVSGKITPSPPVFSLCLPSPASCEKKDPYSCTPNCTTGKGPMCLQKTTFAGPVPIKMQAEVTLNACVSMGTYVDPVTIEPAFRVVPGVGVGIDLRGGVGGSVGPLEAFAGVRAVLTILQIDFPISWGVRVEKKATDPNGTPIENLYLVKFQRKVGIDITVLKLVASLFAEVGISIFKIEWEMVIFQFGGFTFHIDLGGPGSGVIEQKKVDLEHPAALLGTP